MGSIPIISNYIKFTENTKWDLNPRWKLSIIAFKATALDRLAIRILSLGGMVDTSDLKSGSSE